MTDPFLPAFGVLLGGVIVSRFIAENALKLLPADKKAALVDAFSNQRKFGLLILVAMVVATFQWPMLMAVALVGYVVATQCWTYWRLRKMALPNVYVQRYLVSAAVSLLALTVFIVILFWPK